jgi:hypothetical protein
VKITPANISKAVNVSFNKFDHFRRARSKFLNQMVGRHYHGTMAAEKEEKKAAPLNLLHSAVGTLLPNLVYNDPKAMVKTEILMYRPYADLLGLGLNNLVKRINLRMTLRKAILDSIFMAGFIKTGIAAGDNYLSFEGTDIELGQPYAERVDPDDMILDPMARDWDEQNLIGHRFRADPEVLAQTGLYDPDELMRLSSRYEGDTKDSAESLSGNKYDDIREIVKYIDLVEVYLPREKVCVTMPYRREHVTDKFLAVADYEGPARGPYHMLGFTPVSDNVLPVPPAGIWYDLHILGNRIARKMARQAERAKSIVAYQGDAAEDMQKIADADDGEAIPVENVDKIKEVKYGGTTQESYQWMDWVKNHFSELAGNLDMLSGQGDNTNTATQAEMLQANSSVRLSDMQGQVYAFTAEVMEDLAYHLHTDPLIELPLTKRVNGTETQVILNADTRQGDWLDFNIHVKPYSMARSDPNLSVRRKMEFATNVIPAAAQAMMLLGPGFNVGAFLSRIAQEVGIDDVDEFINDQAMMQYITARAQASMISGDPGKAQPGGGPPAPAMPGQIGQPNPSAMGPTGGISPDTEQAMGQQEAAGELQAAAGTRPSANALAQARGL